MNGLGPKLITDLAKLVEIEADDLERPPSPIFVIPKVAVFIRIHAADTNELARDGFRSPAISRARPVDLPG